MKQFRGSTDWVHAREDYKGAPSGAYWPGGASGVTVRPGIDFGYIDRELVEQHIKPIVTPTQWGLLINSRSKRGKSAEEYIDNHSELEELGISYDEGKDLFPLVAEKYWRGIKNRFPGILEHDTPNVIHTVMLSLAFNRGIYNDDLEQLRPFIQQNNWEGFADTVGQMQQNHPLVGIRRRRKKEERHIEYILEALSHAQSAEPLPPDFSTNFIIEKSDYVNLR